MKGATTFVITADRRGSRRGPDLVPATLTRLQSVRPKPLRAFDRTAGDEIQGVAQEPLTVVDVVVTLMRSDDWRLGIGIGPVNRPLPRQARAGRGRPSSPHGMPFAAPTRRLRSWAWPSLRLTLLRTTQNPPCSSCASFCAPGPTRAGRSPTSSPKASPNRRSLTDSASHLRR